MSLTLEQYLATLAGAGDHRLERFAAALYEKADAGLIALIGPEAMSSLARKGLAFLDALGTAPLAVTAFAPDGIAGSAPLPYSVLMLALKDRPFIVDSVQAELRRRGLAVADKLHPTVLVSRAADGSIVDLGQGAAGSNTRREAFEVYLLDAGLGQETLDAAAQGVRAVLGDVILATDDYRAMLERSRAVAGYLRALSGAQRAAAAAFGAQDCDEDAAFLDWLEDDNFVFLGYREYEIVDAKGRPALGLVDGSGLGVLRKVASSAYRTPVPLDELPAALRERVAGGRFFLVTKANSEATVHRARRMDYIGVKRLSEAGVVLGEQRFVGLFTTKGLAAPVEDVPILRSKLRSVLERDQAIPGSHDYKAIVAAFNGLPREELFWLGVDQIHADIRTIMRVGQDPTARLTLHEDPLGRGLAAMVVMPREGFSDDVRRAVQGYLTEALAAKRIDSRLAIGEDEEHARFHFYFVTDSRLADLDVKALERQVQRLSRSWSEAMRELLVAAHGENAGRTLAARYSQVFDERFRATVAPEQAVADIEHLERLAERPRVVDLAPAPAATGTADAAQALLRVYHRGHGLALSDVLPLLENVGLRVIEQYPYNLLVDGESRGVDVYTVVNATGGEFDVEAEKGRLVEALEGLLAGEVENDELNRLVLRARLSARQVALLRAYQMYYAQVNLVTSRSFVSAALLAHPRVAALLMRYFEARFDPAFAGGAGAHSAERERASQSAHQAVIDSLGEVSSLAEDGALRGLLDLMAATVRTSYFLGLERISFKLDSAKVGAMPEPRPMFEIAVSAPLVEGTHLRGGRVARGGIRWSDRPDDFRTEVLGLLKTQTTKNAVIVPVGSKGGFVIKGAPTDRDQLRDFVRAQYRTYIRGLLDLTDNLVAGAVVHPKGLVIYDEPDPYLVVAADKGTATFSDLANATSAEYGFWLGDAFASGGSAGYDHKGMGITARGAWEAVKRHFAELGLDVFKDTFTVAGIGDMSGDVFGNGLLYTDRIRLQAAFNHLHVFLDPDPDPKASFAERRRLFELPRSTWADYDAAKISRGGGVFERSAKSIPLSPEVKRMLGVSDDALSGQDLIRAVLRMEVDLLWNGGIGTYVKASSERNAEVGDSANDGVRIDGTELRATVVGEGGNLGFTQLGRIEYALAGGRINTDAIDNSAGVDTSDHEVNIKILFQPLVAAGTVALAERDELLKAMSDDVARLVLAHNRAQPLALSLAQRASREDLGLYSSLLDYLVENSGLNPHVEKLPTARQLEERRRAGQGLTRPELSVMLAYVKMGLYRRLLETDLPSEPRLQHYLLEYFPAAVRERFPEAIAQHRLHREIVATVLTNTLVDELGLAFVHKAMRQNGVTPIEVVRATLLALELLDAKAVRAHLDARAADVPAEAYYSALEQLVAAVESVVGWMLFNDVGHGGFDEAVTAYRPQLAELRGSLVERLPEAERDRYDAAVADLVEQGFETPDAELITGFDYLADSLRIVDIASDTGVPLGHAAQRFYQLGERLSLGWLREAIESLPSSGQWEQVALVGLVMDLRSVQQGLTTAYVASGPDESAGVDAALEAFVKTAGGFKRFELALEQLREPGVLDLASGSVLVRILEQARTAANAGAMKRAVAPGR
ncbi:MAG: NAD-glutamate dehydrogenase [Trueperaceae bacterium]|nr:NAD-glutamate dehydrogenase [Trueperaceae bacterium]